MGTLAGYLIQINPEISNFIKPFIVKKLRKITFLPTFEVYDSFGPRNPQFDFILPVAESSVYFIQTEEQLRSVNITSDMIGLDSEWKPTFTKSDKVQVSILQIAEKDVRFT